MGTNIDMTEISARHSSQVSAARTRRRHWAEWRLKAYGIAAIGLAALALLTLLGTVATKTAGVVFEYYATMEVEIDLSSRDKAKIDDPNPRVRAALNKPVREALMADLPGKLDRKEARELIGLLSTDAGLELGDLVKADPSLIGQTFQYDALLDDVVQMYLKGLYGRLKDAGRAGEAGIALAEDGETVILTLAPDATSEAREAMRAHRREQARRQMAEANRNAFAVSETERALAEASSEERRAEIQAQLDRFKARRDAAKLAAEKLNREGTNLDVTYTLTEEDPTLLVNIAGGWVKAKTLAQGEVRGTVVQPLSNTDSAAAGEWKAWLFERPELARNISDRQLIWIKNLENEGRIVRKLNTRLLTSSDSSNAELAGIWGALVGSFWTMIVTFLLAFPVGVMAAIYLEEFAAKNRLTDLVEVNINNLAAVPSIVFGLLGVTVFISGVKLFGFDVFDGLLKSVIEDPRSTPLAGGVVLALMSLPTIIIAARASIKAVPPSIRDAALGLGASRLQTATHHVLPLAMPGILTGSIIAMAQALGETAPLIIIGMNSFIQEAPGTPADKGNVLPSLIYLWTNNSERLFEGKTAVAIAVLLIFLIAMNALAVLLRKQFERRW